MQNVENAYDNFGNFRRSKGNISIRRVSCHFEMYLRGQVPCNVVYVMYVYISRRETDTSTGNILIIKRLAVQESTDCRIRRNTLTLAYLHFI